MSTTEGRVKLWLLLPEDNSLRDEHGKPNICVRDVPNYSEPLVSLRRQRIYEGEEHRWRAMNSIEEIFDPRQGLSVTGSPCMDHRFFYLESESTEAVNSFIPTEFEILADVSVVAVAESLEEKLASAILDTCDIKSVRLFLERGYHKTEARKHAIEMKSLPFIGISRVITTAKTSASAFERITRNPNSDVDRLQNALSAIDLMKDICPELIELPRMLRSIEE